MDVTAVVPVVEERLILLLRFCEPGRILRRLIYENLRQELASQVVLRIPRQRASAVFRDESRPV